MKHGPMAALNPAISLVIPTYRRPERLARLIAALDEQTLAPDRFEVIIVDDCSGDETAEVLSAAVDQVQFVLRPLRLDANSGPGPARNLGWQSARAPIIAFTDDDCVPEPGWLAAGLEAMSTDPRLGVLQGRTREPDGLDGSNVERWSHRQRISGPTPWFETCNIFYRRDALKDAGGFGEFLTAWGGWFAEDTAAGWGALHAGWSRGFTGDAVVIHDEETRSVRWYLDKGILEAKFVELAAVYPEFRREAFWRPWALRREDAAFVLAMLGLAAATRWRPAAGVALPYLWWRRPSIHQTHFFRRGAETVAVDAARFAGHIYGAVRNRIFVI